MARPVRIRVHYREDAAFLLRLETAVQKDLSQPEKWRREATELLHSTARKLLEANQDRPQQAAAKS